MTLVVNPKAQMLWEYENFEFNSYAVIDGVTYGANATGLYIVDSGDTDGTTPINSEWSFSKLALTKGQSRVHQAYIKAVADGELTLDLAVDDNEATSYTVGPILPDQSHRYRVTTGKGARGAYWKLALKNVSGCDFRVDEVTLDMTEGDRRL